MERLTYWNEEYGCWSYHGPSGEAAKRLAAYEDTGLEPEEIFSAVDMAKIACALRELNVYKELGSIDCLRKLAGGPGETSTITNGVGLTQQLFRLPCFIINFINAKKIDIWNGLPICSGITRSLLSFSRWLSASGSVNSRLKSSC